ncbi:MAG: restriction endonuclease subunit S [Pseudoruegeria sp.]
MEVQPEESYRQIGVRSHGRGVFHKDAVTGAALGGKRVFHVVPNSFVVNIVFAWEQAIALISDDEKNFIASHRFPMFLEKNEKSFLPFIREFFLRKRGKQLLELASPGGAGRNKTLGQQEFLKLKVRVPERNEQKKIAALLGVVDAKIAALRDRQAGLTHYKRGLMQALFSQTLRFTQPDGTPFPDWEEKRLGEVLTIGSGRDYKHLSEGSIPVYGTGGYMTSVDQYLFDGESVCIGRKGTIDSPTLLTGKFWTVDTLFYTHSFKGVSPRFIFAIFLQINWKKHNEASGVPSLSKGTIEKLKVQLPHPDEQAKIAEALQAMDAKIAAVAGQVAQMEAFKKGLLQQMFV